MSLLRVQDRPEWDWYQGTPEASTAYLHAAIVDWWGDRGKWEDGARLNGYQMARKYVSEETNEALIETYWGGHNPLPNVIGRSEAAIEVAAFMRHHFRDRHKVSRLDAKVDRTREGLFSDVERMLAEKRDQYPRVGFSHEGPMMRKTRSDMIAGTTLYVGSGYPWLIRFYEKGPQMAKLTGNRAWLRVPEWRDAVRGEVSYRPSRRFKAEAAKWEPAELFGISDCVADLMAAFCGIAAEPVGRKLASVGEWERKRQWIAAQGGNVLRHWIEEVGDEQFLEEIKRRIGLSGE